MSGRIYQLGRLVHRYEPLLSAGQPRGSKKETPLLALDAARRALDSGSWTEEVAIVQRYPSAGVVHLFHPNGRTVTDDENKLLRRRLLRLRRDATTAGLILTVASWRLVDPRHEIEAGRNLG